jgi:hypothetical protein
MISVHGRHLVQRVSMVGGMNRFELFVIRNRINPFVSNTLVERIRASAHDRCGSGLRSRLVSPKVSKK